MPCLKVKSVLPEQLEQLEQRQHPTPWITSDIPVGFKYPSLATVKSKSKFTHSLTKSHTASKFDDKDHWPCVHDQETPKNEWLPIQPILDAVLIKQVGHKRPKLRVKIEFKVNDIHTRISKIQAKTNKFWINNQFDPDEDEHEVQVHTHSFKNKRKLKSVPDKHGWQEVSYHNSFSILDHDDDDDDDMQWFPSVDINVDDWETIADYY